MKTAISIDPALDDLLHALFTCSRQKKRKIITIEAVLGSLIEAPQVAKFINTQLQPGSAKALRDELQEALSKEFSAERTAMEPIERLWSYRLKTRMKSMLRLCLPFGVTPMDRWLDDGPSPSEEFERVLSKALLRVIPVRDLQATDLLLSIIENTQGTASAILQRHGISRFNLVCFLVHDSRPRAVYSELDFPGDRDEVCLFLLNDDFSPMPFVVDVLETIFSMSSDAAKSVAMDIHKNGRAACGTFPFAIANHKLRQVEKMADERQHPLRAALVGI